MKWEFRDVPGLNGKYRISLKPEVYGPRKKTPLKLLIRGGYLTFCARKQARTFSAEIYIHRAIMMLWRPIEGMETLVVDHIDGNKLNNSLDNLRWVTHRENALHNIELGIHSHGERHGCAKLSESDVLYIRRNYRHQYKKSNAQDLADMFSVSKSTIQRAANGERWRHVKEPK